MKKLNVFAVMFISFFISSCNKHSDDIVKPQNSPKVQGQNLAHFDESNSPKVTWDELPAKLKNAIPLKTTEKSKNASASNNLSSSFSVTSSPFILHSIIGPWGGSGGSLFESYPPDGSSIYAMAIRSGGYVDRLTVWYKAVDGTIYVGARIEEVMEELIIFSSFQAMNIFMLYKYELAVMLII
jgi:hypothetical protein